MSDKVFPRFKAISQNVQFWENIYSKYSLTEAVIHDSEDLSKIYEIIPLLGDDLPGAARFNSIFQRQAKEKYRAILLKLTTQKPTTQDEKRVAAFFSGKNRSVELARAANNVRSQRGQKERFLNGVIHSGRYMKEIKRIFRSYHLPEELAYLPHVESSFNFKAYSKFGAAGIWQFTRVTGKQYLTIDYIIDERLDPILATHAAAKYLKNSNDTLNSWPLALTSYNYGLSGMLRAVNDEGNYERIFNNYSKGYFKFASKNFYSEFLAALKVAQEIEANPNIKVDAAQSTRYLSLRGYVHIKKISNHFGISTETIQALNPGLLAPVISGEKHIPKGYVVRLPVDKNTNRLIATIPSNFYEKKQKPSLFHLVRAGETAGSVAKQHDIPLKSLVKANNLDKNATIYLKQRLRIPNSEKNVTKSKQNIIRPSNYKNVQKMPSGVATSSPVLLATSKKTHSLRNGINFLPTKDSTVYNVFNIHNKKGKTFGYIIVQPEESLGLYENWLGVADTTLSDLNGLPPNAVVKPGQQLLLVFESLPPTSFEEKRLDFLQETEEDFFSVFTIIGQKMYQVISGDTLWDLCYNKFDIPLWLLKRYNSSISLTRLDRNQELVIPIIQQI